MRPSERAALVTEISAVIHTLETRLDEAHRNCRDWQATGYSHNSLPAPGSSGTHSDPVHQAVANPQHDYKREAKEADRALLQARSALNTLTAFVERNAPRTAGVYCGNILCDRVMTGKGNDRPRGQLRECPRCYIHRNRHGQAWPNKPDPVTTVSPTVDHGVTLPASNLATLST